MLQTFVERCMMFSPEEILTDPSVQLSPLFRAVMARQHQLPDVAAAYAEQARAELERKPMAREIFGALLEFLTDA
jgi:hypothetical protein